MAKLFGYFRSSSAFRVRIALALKNIEVEHIPVNLMPGVDGQLCDSYKALNPQQRVPLWVDDEATIAQSTAILEYLEEKYPTPALLPQNLVDRAYVRQLSSLVAADIQPLNNLSVLKYLKETLKLDEAGVSKWYHHWIDKGFSAYEAYLTSAGKMGQFSFGDSPSMADVYLLPQIWNARRFNTPLEAYPSILKIEKNALAHPAFVAALPENQSDAPKT